jgi:uncharacterized membrane protein YgaE (UPF0421/DUF939 family)
VKRLWDRLSDAVSWTPPTSTEIGTVAKSGLAAGLAWWISELITDIAYPILASLTAVVVVQVSVRASVRTALQRSGAVVLGVLIAVGVGDALDLNALTVALLVGVSLGVAQLVFRLPPAAARQVPLSGLVVLSAVASSQQGQGWRRALDTLLGAAVGVAVSLLLPASRLVDARQTLSRLSMSLGDLLQAMGEGLQHPWSTDQTEEWRRTARTARERLVDETEEAVGNGRESARWNLRDRRHLDELSRYEQVMPKLERTAIGVSVISRGLDDHAHLAGTTHAAMPAMGALFIALAGAVRVLVQDVLGEPHDGDITGLLKEVGMRRTRCVQAATRRARSALDHDGDVQDGELLEGEWLSYAALLVQVDRIVDDLSAPVPA